MTAETMISLNEIGTPSRIAICAMTNEGINAAIERRGPSEE